MEHLERRARQLNRARRLRLLRRGTVCLLALGTLIVTFVFLLLPAYTQQRPTFCGEDHEHTLACYADPQADVETPADWEAGLPEGEEDLSPGERVAEVARSQLGYRESVANYRVGPQEELQGYTRYGAWAGDPYGPWNAAFGAFCLHYGEAWQPWFPEAGDPAAWEQALKDQGRWEDLTDQVYRPTPGDLAFFRQEDDALSLGIVTGADPEAGTLACIAGDCPDAVTALELETTHRRFVGFGRLFGEEPEAPPREEPQEETNPQQLQGEAEGVTVTVELETPVEEGCTLEVTDLPVTEEAVRKLEESLSQELPDGVRKQARVEGDSLRLVEIALVDEAGQPVEPPGEMVVSLASDDLEQIDDTPAVAAVDRETARLVEAAASGEGVTFTERSLAGAYAFSFTVDFYYEGYETHLPGLGETTLSQLFSTLGIQADAALAQEVTFSDPTLVAMEPLEGDWRLTSLEPFDTEETLTVTLANGDRYVITVRDAKNYAFEFNVNDPAAGCVYENQNNHASSITVAVSDSGLAAGTVRPRSADEPTNGHLHATRGYRFVGWLVNGGTIYGTGNTGGATADLYSIHPQVGEGGVADRAQTFTACFAPEGQYIITFDTRSDNQGAGFYDQGLAKSFSYLAENGAAQSIFFCYSGSRYGAIAQAAEGSVFEGWYDTESNLICSTPLFVAPENLDRDLKVRAQFRKARDLTVTYSTYGNGKNGSTTPNIGRVTAAGQSGRSVTETVKEGTVPGPATASKVNGYTFVCWRDAAGNLLTRDYILSLYSAATEDATYYAEYVSNDVSRILVLSNVREYGTVTLQDGTPVGEGLQGYEVLENGNVQTNRTYYARPAEGFVFDHWEFNGKHLPGNDHVLNLGVPPDPNRNPQVLMAVFVPECKVTYDLSPLQQVGINTPDWQHWVDVPWCPKDVRVARKGLTALGEDLYQEQSSYGQTFNLPDLTAQTRVSQTNNGYNLLTHTFKGWRVQGDAEKKIYKPGEPVRIIGSVTLEAVWDAYFDGKTGYYKDTDMAAYRYNTNTCGFFVRLYGEMFNIGDTGTYTDCLFTTRLLGAPLFEGNGHRADFYGNSQATDRSEIDDIDAYLREHAASGIVTQEGSGFTAGSVMQLAQPFPSDDFIFSRIREWNARQIAENTGRRIQFNGVAIPQEQLTSDFYELRWYVLKDQENSWHIDGMLIPKYAKLVVKKSFVGDEAAIARVKAGNFYIGVAGNRSETDGQDQESIQLNLQPKSLDNPRGYVSVDSEGKTYTWYLDDLLPLTGYWVAEHHYSASSPYSTSKSWQVSNTLQSQTGGSSYRAEIRQVYSYPDDESWDAVQTVAFANRYTKPRELSLIKLDATTNHPLAGVSFRFTLYARQDDGTEVEITRDYRTDQDGRITVTFPTTLELGGRTVSIPNGAHRFSITEALHEGYLPLTGPITGTVTLSDTSDSTLALDPGSPGLAGLSEEKSILYVGNQPEKRSVTVTKTWIGSSRPVTMQLLRDGVPWLGKSVTLGAPDSLMQADPEHTTRGWTYTWKDLPAYVDGAPVIYTVREEWIGVPGGTDSLHYSTANDADGYLDYQVNQTQTADAQGNIAVYVENTPDTGQVTFTKIDENQRAVPGAEFTVYTDAACTVPIKAGQYTTETDKDHPAVFVPDANGIVTVQGLQPGNYYMKETRAPLGYVIEDPRVFRLEVRPANSTLTTDSGQPVTSVTNPLYAAEVVLRKVLSGTDVPLSGAVFELHGAAGDHTMEPAPLRGYEALVTGEDGQVRLGRLKRGEYYLVERRAPLGYEPIAEPIRLTVPDSSATAISAIKSESNTSLPVNDGTVTIGNTSGIFLPATGGGGREPPMLAGLLLAGAAAGLLLARRARRKGGEGP